MDNVVKISLVGILLCLVCALLSWGFLSFAFILLAILFGFIIWEYVKDKDDYVKVKVKK